MTNSITEPQCAACTYHMIFVEGQAAPVRAEVAWRCTKHEKEYHYYHPAVGFDADGIVFIDEGQFL